MSDDRLNYRIKYPWRLIKVATGELQNFSDAGPVWDERGFPIWKDRETAEAGAVFLSWGNPVAFKPVPWPTVWSEK